VLLAYVPGTVHCGLFLMLLGAGIIAGLVGLN